MQQKPVLKSWPLFFPVGAFGRAGQATVSPFLPGRDTLCAPEIEKGQTDKPDTSPSIIIGKAIKINIPAEIKGKKGMEVKDLSFYFHLQSKHIVFTKGVTLLSAAYGHKDKRPDNSYLSLLSLLRQSLQMFFPQKEIMSLLLWQKMQAGSYF